MHQIKQKLTLYFTCILFKRNDQMNEQTNNKQVYCIAPQSVNKTIAVVFNEQTAIFEIRHV